MVRHKHLVLVCLFFCTGNHWKFPDNLVNVDFLPEITSTFRTIQLMLIFFWKKLALSGQSGLWIFFGKSLTFSGISSLCWIFLSANPWYFPDDQVYVDFFPEITSTFRTIQFVDFLPEITGTFQIIKFMLIFFPNSLIFSGISSLC